MQDSHLTKNQIKFLKELSEVEKLDNLEKNYSLEELRDYSLEELRDLEERNLIIVSILKDEQENLFAADHCRITEEGRRVLKYKPISGFFKHPFFKHPLVVKIIGGVTLKIIGIIGTIILIFLVWFLSKP